MHAHMHTYVQNTFTQATLYIVVGWHIIAQAESGQRCHPEISHLFQKINLTITLSCKSTVLLTLGKHIRTGHLKWNTGLGK